MKKKLLNDKNNLIIQKQKKISKSSKEINNYGKAKKKREKNKIGHNKYSDDNLRMKCKYLVLKHLRNFLNDKIRVIYNGNIGKGLFEKQLKIINQSQTRNGTVNFNKNFLNAKIKDIFSINITKKYNYFPLSHNKKLINELLNERDENKREYFNKLFNLEFIECLWYFSGEKHIDILEGLKCFVDIKDEISKKYENNADGEKYYQAIKYYLNNYEKIILNKKARKPRKKLMKKTN